jgi:hypothetical protein
MPEVSNLKVWIYPSLSIPYTEFTVFMRCDCAAICIAMCFNFCRFSKFLKSHEPVLTNHYSCIFKPIKKKSVGNDEYVKSASMEKNLECKHFLPTISNGSKSQFCVCISICVSICNWVLRLRRYFIFLSTNFFFTIIIP